MTTHTNNSPAGAAAHPGDSMPGHLRRILYVEDDKAVRAIYSMMLEESGYSVDAADDGLAAWEDLQHRKYDLLITDNEMPRLNGLELVKRLRSAGQGLPVIIASGTFTIADAEWQRWRMVTALPKPFSPEELLQTIQEVLRAPTSVPQPTELFFPALVGAFYHVEPVLHWGINE